MVRKIYSLLIPAPYNKENWHWNDHWIPLKLLSARLWASNVACVFISPFCRWGSSSGESQDLTKIIQLVSSWLTQIWPQRQVLYHCWVPSHLSLGKNIPGSETGWHVLMSMTTDTPQRGGGQTLRRNLKKREWKREAEVRTERWPCPMGGFSGPQIGM